MSTTKTRAIIIGAGPAGLTAAVELLDRTEVVPIVLEMSHHNGGIARTVNYKGNRIDIGGHRFFSKSDRVMNWWVERLPIQGGPDRELGIAYQGKTRRVRAGDGPDPETSDEVMLVRDRKSRIYYLRTFFDYPVRLNTGLIRGLGAKRMVKIGLSYAKAVGRPIPEPENLEQFFINRFGKELYLTFFKSYTEKVWGVKCRDIPAEWGAQRIKGLSIREALKHFVKSRVAPSEGTISQKGTQTSLIERFLYPKRGPGQLWDVVSAEVVEKGGQVLMGWRVVELGLRDGALRHVVAVDADGVRKTFEGELFFSTMPLKELVAAVDGEVPDDVREVAEGLVYRDFITVGILADRLERERIEGAKITDNWIYIQEPDVKLGRLQIFNNWSPWMVADPTKVWLGLEYFCSEGDELWSLSDEALQGLGARELEQIGLVNRSDIRDSTVIRMPKTYPAYFGTYDRFDVLRSWLDRVDNLFCIGRNGMHRYNNQDHSMLTAMIAVDNLVAGDRSKANLWSVNTEQAYQEEKEH